MALGEVGRQLQRMARITFGSRQSGDQAFAAVGEVLEKVDSARLAQAGA